MKQWPDYLKNRNVWDFKKIDVVLSYENILSWEKEILNYAKNICKRLFAVGINFLVKLILQISKINKK